MMWGYGGGYWVFMGITMVLFWGLIIAGIVALVRYLGGARHSPGPHPTGAPARPEEVLAERFARGEIDAEEYEKRLELLRARR